MNNYKKTAAGIIDKSLRLCADYRGQGKNGRRFSWKEAQKALSRVVFRLVERTAVLKKVSVIELQQGRIIYDLPPDCLYPVKIQKDSLVNGSLLYPGQAENIDITGDYTQTGTPEYFVNSLLNHNQLGFLPGTKTGSSFEREEYAGIIRRVISGDKEYTDFFVVSAGAIRGIEGVDLDSDEGYAIKQLLGSINLTGPETGIVKGIIFPFPSSPDDLSFDADAALRDIKGVPFFTSGRDFMVRDIKNPAGNVVVTYIRKPFIPDYPYDVVEPGLPAYIYKDLPYGVSSYLLLSGEGKIDYVKYRSFSKKWNSAVLNLQRQSYTTGNNDIRPV